jgi:hypothetical protein
MDADHRRKIVMRAPAVAAAAAAAAPHVAWILHILHSVPPYQSIRFTGKDARHLMHSEEVTRCTDPLFTSRAIHRKGEHMISRQHAHTAPHSCDTL